MGYVALSDPVQWIRRVLERGLHANSHITRQTRIFGGDIRKYRGHEILRKYFKERYLSTLGALLEVYIEFLTLLQDLNRCRHCNSLITKVNFKKYFKFFPHLIQRKLLGSFLYPAVNVFVTIPSFPLELSRLYPFVEFRLFLRCSVFVLFRDSEICC